MNDDPGPSAPGASPTTAPDAIHSRLQAEVPGELAALLREIRDRLPPARPATGWQRLQNAVRMAEPWGVLIGVIALVFALWAFQVEQAAREEDRINRAIGQFADGIGRIDALGVLLRNNVNLKVLKAPGAVLPKASLSGANLVMANLSSAILISADLRDADLLEADLSNADLSNANLASADLSNADLRDADLHDANLSNADFFGVDLSDAILCKTTMPDDSRCDRDCYPSGACPWLD